MCVVIRKSRPPNHLPISRDSQTLNRRKSTVIKISSLITAKFIEKFADNIRNPFANEPTHFTPRAHGDAVRPIVQQQRNSICQSIVYTCTVSKSNRFCRDVRVMMRSNALKTRGARFRGQRVASQWAHATNGCRGERNYSRGLPMRRRYSDRRACRSMSACHWRRSSVILLVLFSTVAERIRFRTRTCRYSSISASWAA